jgi:hypothetical protein
MSDGAINLQELSEHITLALTAGKKIGAVPTDFGDSPVPAGSATRIRLLEALGRSLWKFVKPYCAVLSIAERVVDSAVFDRQAFLNLHDRLLPLERMADDILATSKKGDYFNRTLTAAPLVSLNACNERIKDCMVAIESSLDPHLDDLMAAALEEHQRGETIPLDSIN